MDDFFNLLERRIAPYDLLKHPYYQAWTAGELTQSNLAEYGAEYWHHVSAFPAYLSALHSRLPDGPLRRTVLRNLVDEEGLPHGRPHSDLWMDFAAGMGADAAEVRTHTLNPSTERLISHFGESMHSPACPAAALATLYAYESRVPAIAESKADGLRKHYNADESTVRYFTVHQKADIHHARVWQEALDEELALHPEDKQAALDAAESAARVLWEALDGIESNRQSGRTAEAG